MVYALKKNPVHYNGSEYRERQAVRTPLINPALCLEGCSCSCVMNNMAFDKTCRDCNLGTAQTQRFADESGR